MKVKLGSGRRRTGDVSIRRADYWLVEGHEWNARGRSNICFNPPGGLLVG